MHNARNHRRLGRELELFDTAPIVGAGLPLWLPAGAIIRSELETLAVEQARESGCQRVYTPVLAKRELFERSGHWEKFSEDMFPEMKVGGDDFVLRPANCPHHAQVYASRGRSYRELPIRFSEIGSMFRSEPSGNVGGLSRVRQITLDDAHSFCREDQVGDEVKLALRAIQRVYEILGIEIAYYRLSLRGPSGQYVGDSESWQRAENHLRDALVQVGAEYVEAPGEAAFYGPKIDVQVRDANGQDETLSTVQVDYGQPERFALAYTDENSTKQRPVMIHRGLLGSVERMTALLIERYAGRLPTWLAPVQLRILPVSAERNGQAAHLLCERMRAAGLRAEVADRGSLGSRIRVSRSECDAYFAVLGDGEERAEAVNLTCVSTGAQASIGVPELIDVLSTEVSSRSRTFAVV